MRNYKEYPVWQQSLELVECVYRVSESMPRKETFGIQSQIRRAAVSISANLAEGAGRDTESEFRRFIDIALGSINEVETLTLIAGKLGYFGLEQVDQLNRVLVEVRKQLIGLHKRLRPKRKAS